MLRDWSLFTGRGATKWENRGLKLFARPLPQDRVIFFAPPPFYRVEISCTPLSIWLKRGYCIKTTPKLFVPLLQHG